LQLSGPELAAGWQGRWRTSWSTFPLGRTAAAAAIAGSAALAVVLRLPFVGTGLSPDEGGYAYVAGRWAHGARLYGADWVDRPQGLLIAYRFLLYLGHSASSIRLGAVAFGCGITLLLGVAGWLVRGPWTGAAAALVFAVVGVAPHLQGFTFNGELVAALPATAAVVAALAWRRDGRIAWLVVAGAAGALGVLMKQSGFDGLLVTLVVAATTRSGRRRGACVAAVAAGALVPFALSVTHGLLVGWHGYWYAVAGYKLSASSGAAAGIARRLGDLGGSLLGARRDLAIPATVAAGLTITALLRRQPLRIPLLWLGAAFLGFNTASLYWPHYYVQLLPPLALLIAVGATTLPGRVLAPAAILLVVGPALLKLDALEDMSLGAKRAVIPYYGQYVRDERVARAVDRRTRPGESIYALDSEPDLYFLADRPADFPYLWAHPLEEIPGAVTRLRALLAGPDRPALVVVFRPPRLVDRTGGLSRILARDYRPLEAAPGTSIELLQRT
jgi:hypothetical protein